MKNWIDRQRNIVDFTLSSLLRRKKKNAALIFVYTLVVFSLSSVLFFSQSLKKEASIILKEAPEMVIQKIVAGRHEQIPTSYIAKIEDIRGITELKARLWGYYYDPVTGANYTLVVNEDSGLSPGTIAIGNGVAKVRLAFKGDTIEFKAYDGKIFELEVREILSPESSLVSADLIVISEEDFRRLFSIPNDRATDLILRVANPRELPTIALKIAERLPDTRQVLTDDILRTYDAVFNWRSGLMIAIFSGALLAFIIFAWDKASGLSAEERREIGILKAIGWETSDVILMKFWEGLVVSLSAFLIGVILGYIHIFLTSARLFAPVLKGWAVLYPQFKITPFIDGALIASLFFFTVVPYTAATIIPSWKAAIVDPDSVMR
ncbi:MAG: FtsX-like permease family protein [Candidatus Aminicenantes bacterium]|nr:FtsX-like permease family protein [Candidatus Aminicenantes bacterium]MDH5385498.1 FtsX-like permease family protein [Candidatus Aminicenantes bacterium]